MADAARPWDHGSQSPMTVDEFRSLPASPDGTKYELVNGELRAQAPASSGHSIVQLNAGRLIGNHLAGRDGPCWVGTEPGVSVRLDQRHNLRNPDLGVSCTPHEPGMQDLPDPVVLIEILSPGNKKATWDNVWSYVSIPTLREILVLSSWAIEAQVIARADGGVWPDNPDHVTPGGDVVLPSIAFRAPLVAFYAQTYMLRDYEKGQGA